MANNEVWFFWIAFWILVGIADIYLLFTVPLFNTIDKGGDEL